MLKNKLNKKLDFAMLSVIFALAWPTMLEELMQTAVQYIDTAMVGSLGTDATAAVGATGTVGWLVLGVMNAMGVGFLAFIAQAFGAGEREKAKAASAQAVSMTVVIGLFMTALVFMLSSAVPRWMNVDLRIRDLAGRYFLIVYSPMLFRAASIVFGTVLRSVGDTKTPMRVGIVVNIINIIANFLLIYPTRTISLFGKALPMWGAGWGVEGAGIASAFSFVVGGSAMTVALFRHKDISPNGQKFLPNMKILKPCIKVGIPNMFQRFGTSLGFVVFAALINALGGMSTAAHTIANTVESAFYIPGYGMMAAAATLSGNALGAKNKEKLKSLGKTIIPLEIGLMIISGGLLFIFAEPLMGIFSRDAEVIALGTTVLRMVAISEPFYGVPIVVEGMMQGVGKTVAPLYFNISGMWLIRILGTYICTVHFGMGLISAWACMIGHNLLLFFLFSGYYLSGRWNPMNDKHKKA
ncbi:MAG: MATE family efflux transporter [Clostridia bacterium]|nr:MATE family efflux transporter [Clostridia bacterium]